ncbi:unnamed protein product [Pieris macdunnoughi]|uniref:Uncharacterized protein n=1 Tax=Pieris macdunnoughi TaxID=345717 RepID=A0A821Y5X2_9NEOP|nr:unnamed protein product [Pieris macdunnoughi]
MSLSESSIKSTEKEPVVKVIYKRSIDDSSQEAPKSEWSSLQFDVSEENIKKIRYEEGLYDPGSGEICTKYLPLSASSVFRHPYYNYPGIVDPGIKDALLKSEPKTIYPEDGQKLYLALCEESNQCPIRQFYRELLTSKIDLKYYGISSKGVRPIACALKYNRFVTVVDLTDNFLDEDGCYHLGEILIENITLEELNLHGCRIGPEGLKRLIANLHINKSLRTLNLCKNKLGDKGLEYLAKSIFLGADIVDINLSYNELGPDSLTSLCDAFETHNKLKCIDLSWNNIMSANAVFSLCQKFAQNEAFEYINLSWNSLSGAKIGNSIRILIARCPNLHSIYFNNNRLSSEVVKTICAGLVNCGPKLTTLDLSYNKLMPQDAMLLLSCLKNRKVKLKYLLLDNIIVKEEFDALRKEILLQKFRKDTVITHGEVIPEFVPKGVDIREILFNRADFLCKKKRKDIALILLGIHKEFGAQMDTKMFARAIKTNGAPLDEDVVEAMTILFPGAVLAKSKNINLADLVDYLSRKWPDRKLPPTPPPEPEPEPDPKSKKK